MNRKSMHLLVDAAGLIGCQPEDLLRLGEEGEVRIFFRVPDDIAVYSIDYGSLSDESMQDNTFKKLYINVWHPDADPIRENKVRFLALSRFDCQKALVSRDYEQSVFKEGVDFGDDNALVLIHPRLPSNHSHGLQLPRFATYPRLIKEDLPTRKNSGRRKAVVLDDAILYLGVNDIKKIKGSARFSNLAAIQDQMDCYSERLVFLATDVMKIWAKELGDNGVPPKNETISRLLGAYNPMLFNDSELENIPIVTRPRFSRAANVYKIDNGLPENLKVLFEAARQIYGVNGRSKYGKLRKVDIQRMLVTNFNLKEYLARLGASIIYKDGNR